MAKKKSKSLPRKWLVILGLVLLASGLVYAFRETLFWKTYVTEWTYPGDHRGFKVSYPASWEVREWKEYVGNIYPSWELVAHQYVLDICVRVDLCPRQDAIGFDNPVAIAVYFIPHGDLDDEINDLRKFSEEVERNMSVKQLGVDAFRFSIIDQKKKFFGSEMKLIRREDGIYVIDGGYLDRLPFYSRFYYQRIVGRIVDSFELLK